MRKAGDVCFSEVYREGGGKLHFGQSCCFYCSFESETLIVHL